jgi:hypothetical protein
MRLKPGRPATCPRNGAAARICGPAIDRRRRARLVRQPLSSLLLATLAGIAGIIACH